MTSHIDLIPVLILPYGTEYKSCPGLSNLFTPTVTYTHIMFNKQKYGVLVGIHVHIKQKVNRENMIVLT